MHLWLPKETPLKSDCVPDEGRSSLLRACLVPANFCTPNRSSQTKAEPGNERDLRRPEPRALSAVRYHFSRFRIETTA